MSEAATRSISPISGANSPSTAMTDRPLPAPPLFTGHPQPQHLLQNMTSSTQTNIGKIFTSKMSLIKKTNKKKNHKSIQSLMTPNK